MPKIDYERNGVEREYEATTYTLVLYEQEFKGDLIKDVFGKVDLRNAQTLLDDDGNIVVIDYTSDNWMAELKAFWAMLKTSEAICRRENRPCLVVPSFIEWTQATRSIDMAELSRIVVTELNRGLFRAGATASEETE